MRRLAFITLVNISLLTLALASEIVSDYSEDIQKPLIIVSVTVPFKDLDRLPAEKKVTFTKTESKSEQDHEEPTPKAISTVVDPIEEVLLVEKKEHTTPVAVTASVVKTAISLPQKTVYTVGHTTKKVVKKVFKKIM